MKFLFSMLVIAAIVLTGCANSQVYVGAGAGPVDITIAVDNNGDISVSGAVTPEFEVGLGPIELKVGIEKTLELTKEKPYTLFVIWEDESGEIKRQEYEIGKTFHVSFTQNELIQEIQGDNNSVIVVVKKPATLPPVMDLQPSSQIQHIVLPRQDSEGGPSIPTWTAKLDVWSNAESVEVAGGCAQLWRDLTWNGGSRDFLEICDQRRNLDEGWSFQVKEVEVDCTSGNLVTVTLWADPNFSGGYWQNNFCEN